MPSYFPLEHVTYILDDIDDTLTFFNKFDRFSLITVLIPNNFQHFVLQSNSMTVKVSADLYARRHRFAVMRNAIRRTGVATAAPPLASTAKTED